MCDHKKKYTRVHRNCESGLAIIHKHAAHRLVEMTWTNDSTLAIFFHMRYRLPPSHCCEKRLESSGFDIRIMSRNKDKWHQQIAMWLHL